MSTSKSISQTIDQYIATAPEEVQKILQNLREVVKKEIPNATEAMSYGIPTFKLNGKNIVHFAAWKHHIGFYPTPSGTVAFEKELAPYEKAKGSIHFPLDKPMPLDLIRNIVQFRVKETVEKTKK